VLTVDLKDYEGNSRFAVYDDFKVGPEEDKYKLISIGKYNGSAGLYVLTVYVCYYSSNNVLLF